MRKPNKVLYFYVRGKYEVEECRQEMFRHSSLSDNVLCGGTHRAVVARDAVTYELAGIFLFSHHFVPNRGITTLTSSGTFVREKYRRQGIAEQMWVKALTDKSSNRISAVYTYIVATSAAKMMASLRSRFPKIDFKVKFGPNLNNSRIVGQYKKGHAA